jgi:cell division protein FtsZ
MKGAKGLLISITGGKDLTLFEVDEAATRIREEVDPDANIILGATFEESLEGVIRVSVVATGIDSEAREGAVPGDFRGADIAQRLKTAVAKPAAPVQAPVARPAVAPAAAARPAQVAAPVAAKPAPLASAPMAPAPEPAPMAYDISAQMNSPATVAAQPQPFVSHPEITITPFEPAPMRYASQEIDTDPHHHAAAVEEQHHAHAEAPFIPPQPEAPAPRMPKVEDFPVVAQRQMEAHREGPSHDEDRGPLSLLRRLASVGLGRREEDPIGAGAQQRAPAAPQQTVAQRAPQTPRAAAPAPAGGDYAKRPPMPRAATPQEALYRPRQGDLDPHGRPAPQRESRPAEDELEIPAFLRRQAN